MKYFFICYYKKDRCYRDYRRYSNHYREAAASPIIHITPITFIANIAQPIPRGGTPWATYPRGA